MAVNSTTWKKLPIAPRETSFSADDAIARIRQWSAGSTEKFASAFFWRDSRAAGNNVNSYRLPMGDIVNGKLTLIPHAIFTAAAILSGAHGGLEGVVGDEEKDQLKRIITGIYEQFQKMWGDRRTVPPWLRGGNKMGEVVASLGVAPAHTPFNTVSAEQALWEWSQGDLRQYRLGFAHWDTIDPNLKSSYRYPIAVPVDGELRIVPAAVEAAIDMIESVTASVYVQPEDLPGLEAVLQAADQKVHDSLEHAAVAAGIQAEQPAVPIRPDKSLFSDPQLEGPTPLAVSASGEVTGHMWLWNTCHAGIGDRCVMAPRSATGYKFFHNGSVLTADGSMVKVGKITMGTGHANLNLGYVPASDHYDNTGTVIAIVAAGEDRFGGWAHGTVVPEATEAQIQQLRRSPISGDWRRANGNLELVAALAVNTPGFPVVSLAASGEMDTLMAVGILREDGTVYNDADIPLSPPDRSALDRLATLRQEWDKTQGTLRKAQLRTVLKKGI